jgi:hypothetical protein
MSNLKNWINDIPPDGVSDGVYFGHIEKRLAEEMKRESILFAIIMSLLAGSLFLSIYIRKEEWKAYKLEVNDKDWNKHISIIKLDEENSKLVDEMLEHNDTVNILDYVGNASKGLKEKNINVWEEDSLECDPPK